MSMQAILNKGPSCQVCKGRRTVVPAASARDGSEQSTAVRVQRDIHKRYFYPSPIHSLIITIRFQARSLAILIGPGRSRIFKVFFYSLSRPGQPTKQYFFMRMFAELCQKLIVDKVGVNSQETCNDILP